MLARMASIRGTLILLVGIQTGIAILEDSMEVPQKLKKKKKIELHYNLAIALLGTYLRIQKY